LLLTHLLALATNLLDEVQSRFKEAAERDEAAKRDEAAAKEVRERDREGIHRS